MDAWLRFTIIGVALLLALVAYIDFRTRREPRAHTLLIAGLLSALTITQVVMAGIQLGGGHETGEAPTFIGYLATNAILVPAAAYVSRVERSKWASIVLCVAGLVVAVLEVRLQQLWTR